MKPLNERSEATAREHDAMLKALHTLERALTAPAPGREEQWRRRTAAALVVVIDEVRQHCESAEGDNGLMDVLEAQIGRPHELTLAMNEHETLIDEASALLTDLERSFDGESLPCDDVRSRALALAAALRRHQAREADLILLAFDQDIGGED